MFNVSLCQSKKRLLLDQVCAPLKQHFTAGSKWLTCKTALLRLVNTFTVPKVSLHLSRRQPCRRSCIFNLCLIMKNSFEHFTGVNEKKKKRQVVFTNALKHTWFFFLLITIFWNKAWIYIFFSTFLHFCGSRAPNPLSDGETMIISQPLRLQSYLNPWDKDLDGIRAT